MVPWHMSHARSLLLSLVACGPVSPVDSDAGESDAAGTNTTSTGSEPTSEAVPTSSDPGDPDAGCLEVEYPHEDETRPSWRLGCEGPSLCFAELPLIVTLMGDDAEGTNEIHVDDLERARCMVTALAKRQPGQFDFAVTRNVDVLGVYSVEVLGDVAVARTRPGQCWQPPGGCLVHESLRALRPAAFFSDCIDGDARALYLCLVDSFEPTPACLPGPLEC